MSTQKTSIFVFINHRRVIVWNSRGNSILTSEVSADNYYQSFVELIINFYCYNMWIRCDLMKWKEWLNNLMEVYNSLWVLILIIDKQNKPNLNVRPANSWQNWLASRFRFIVPFCAALECSFKMKQEKKKHLYL